MIYMRYLRQQPHSLVWFEIEPLNHSYLLQLQMILCDTAGVLIYVGCLVPFSPGLLWTRAHCKWKLDNGFYIVPPLILGYNFLGSKDPL